jgi:uncharacterized membrane protein YGL010W
MLIISEIFRSPMKTIEEELATYAAYHQDARNKATHFIGVPVIALSLFVPLAWPSIAIGGVGLTAAMALMAIFIVYYLMLDAVLGIAMGIAFGLLLWLGEIIAAQGTAHGWIWFAALFIGGWTLQFVGHIFEGRRPALVDNLFQSVFIAPIFLCAELFFALGYKPALHDAVQERARRLRAAATDAKLTPAS